jgi:hypothetical protein
MNERDRVVTVSPINGEIGEIGGNNLVTRVQFAHSDQAQVREVGMAIQVAAREGFDLSNVLARLKARRTRPVLMNSITSGTLPR